MGLAVAAPEMSRDAWRESATTDVLFPDDLEGYGPVAVTGPPIDAGEADTTTVQFGTVAELDSSHSEDYVVCPRQLRSLIADAWRDDIEAATFEVTSAEKDGHADDSPWVIEGRCITNGDPL